MALTHINGAAVFKPQSLAFDNQSVMAVPHISKAQPRLLSSGTYFVVMDEAGALVGAGGWTAVIPGTGQKGAPRTGHIRHVVTDHRQTRRGLGRGKAAVNGCRY